jgi:hypothetical protein
MALQGARVLGEDGGTPRHPEPRGLVRDSFSQASNRALPNSQGRRRSKNASRF